MESEVADTANPFSGESNSLALDAELYDMDVYDVPDPGLLKEKNELSISETQQALRHFTTHPQWRIMSVRSRARRLWLLLCTGLHGIVEKKKTAEMHVASLVHGLEPLRRLELAAGLRSVAQDPMGCRFVVLDGAGRLHLHREDGWAREKLPAPVALTGLCGLPLPPPPSPTGALTSLALGPARRHHAPRCFAAYGSAVLAMDLHAWALMDVRRDLHKTTISDLAYCEAAEAMVTASRDSTVKVWEANWQIRMVFASHTGPVTALTVLPNTALVLSASQDRTLRTWDLQAAAQVGEVALCPWGPGDVASGRVSRLLAPARPGWPVFSLSAGAVELWRVRELYSPLAQLPAPVLHLQVAPPLPAPPPLPTRLVCACANGSVCLVSASTGRTVSALLLGPEDCAAAVAYCLPREVLWLLTRAGHLVRSNVARCPMHVLHRVCPPPSPAPRPCCLHLYSHITDPASARATWEVVRQHGGELGRSDIAGAWKDKNRYLPVVGRTDGALVVLGWRSSRTVFHTDAHSPGSVTVIASTWNCIVSSGGDLMVKMWRVLPYAEESLSLLRTFSCCHPAVVLCALGTRVTVGFEAPASATYGLVRFGLGNRWRFDHRPQDDPTDHITGLCCCPTPKLCASSGCDCTIRIWTSGNRLLRLLQLNGAPQALTFCGNSGDLVMALGSRLCLVAHVLYLPTSYLVKMLCQEVPEAVDDPPLLLASQELLSSAQLQRLAGLHGAASLSVALSPTRHQKAIPQQPALEEAIEALAARDHDLRQLSLGLVVQAARPPPSWQQHQEAFDNYLHLIYGPGLRSVHSKAPQLHSEWLQQEKQMALGPPSSCLQRKTPLKKRRQEPLSQFRGFFPATIYLQDQCILRPIHFPGFVPNSAVRQGLWLRAEVDGPGALTQLVPKRPPKLGAGQDDFWLSRSNRRHPAAWQRKLVQWLGEKPGAQQPEEEDEELDWSLPSLSTEETPSEESLEPSGQGAPSSPDEMATPPEPGEAAAPSARYSGCSLWEECFKHLPSFLRFFLCQNWFKKLFPLFALETCPEAGTVEGLASLLVGALEGASWTDGVDILSALLRLLPDVSSDLLGRLQRLLVRLLNLDRPPSLQGGTQMQFVMLALQLLLACSLESWDVVLELLTYFLYSPAACQPEIKKLLRGLGLQDPHGFLFREMMTWVQSSEVSSKALLRSRCGQKLEGMVHKLQMETWSLGPAKLSVMQPKVSGSSELSSIVPKELSATASRVSETLSQVPVTPALTASIREPQVRVWRTRRTLSESLHCTHVCPRRAADGLVAPADAGPGAHRRAQLLLRAAAGAARGQGVQPGVQPGAARRASLPRRHHRIPRLQEAQAQPPRSPRGPPLPLRSAGRFLGGSIRTLKLPLPRVEPQPFPLDWPSPDRPLPLLPLQPALQPTS